MAGKKISTRYVGQAIRHARKNELQISRRELGEALGFSSIEIMRFENGNRIMPMATLYKILSAGMALMVLAHRHKK